MKPEHMTAHPTVAGVVWDSNFQKYIPQPVTAENPEELEAFFNSHPAVRKTQLAWGQTQTQQDATSHTWRQLAEAAGTRFDRPEPKPASDPEE